MNPIDYKKMPYGKLYNELVSHVLMFPLVSKELLDEMMESDRYRMDFQFRLVVQTGFVLSFSLFSDYSKAIHYSKNLIEQATALKMWNLVSFNLNVLGNTYLGLGMFDKSFEAFQQIISLEKEHPPLHLTSVAYNNIGLLYGDLGDGKKAFTYYTLSLQHLQEDPMDMGRYLSKYSYALACLIIEMCRGDMIEDAKKKLDELNQLDVTLVDQYSSCLIEEANMYYQFYIGRFDQARKHFLIISDINQTIMDQENYFHILRIYGELCQQFALDMQMYIPDLLQILDFEGDEWPAECIKIYRLLLDYYESIQDDKNIEKISAKYIYYLEKYNERARMDHLNAIQAICDVSETRQENYQITEKNNQLEMIAQEAIMHKDALQAAYHRMEALTEIGQKITSSLNLVEVVNSFYDYLRENIPITTFLLMTVDEQNQKLQSLVFYENEQLQSPIEIPLNSTNSMLVECYRKNQLIISNDLLNDRFFNTRPLNYIGEKAILSVLYLPISFENHTIGICSLQHTIKDSFTVEHLQFLETLRPYLAIAIGNAIQSKALETEIRSHKKTQAKLEKMNRNLKKLSSLDGLTKVYNRRALEEEFSVLIKKSEKHKLSIGLCIIDIDNFKLYNDTYGHLEGDEALIQIAQTMRREFERNKVFFARFGGEEFMAVWIGLSPLKIKNLMENIRQQVVDLKIENKESPLSYLTVSIGVATAKNSDPGTKDLLIKTADKCLYQAKNSGKNQVCITEKESS